MSWNEDHRNFVPTAPPYDSVVEEANKPPQNLDYQSTEHTETILPENERLVDVPSGGCCKEVCCKLFLKIF